MTQLQQAPFAPTILAHAQFAPQRAPRLTKAGKARTPADLPFMYQGGGNFGLWFVTSLLLLCTLGFAYPWVVVMREQHRASHTFIEGRRLIFLGKASSLMGNWIKWWFLSAITVGIYSFWVRGKMHKWTVENYDFA